MDKDKEKGYSSLHLSSEDAAMECTEGEVTERIVTSLRDQNGERSLVDCSDKTEPSSHDAVGSWVRASTDDDLLSEEDSSEDDIAAAEVLPPPRLDDIDDEFSDDGDTLGRLPSFPVGQGGADDDTVGSGFSTETAQVENSAIATRARIQRNMEKSRGEVHIEASRLQSLNLAGPQPLTRKVSGQSSASSSGISGSRRRLGIEILPINEQGHAMSQSELRVAWMAMGRCLECGRVQTHRKVKLGPFGAFRKMEPLTIEAVVYKGYCLACHEVFELRDLLNEPDIPEDLPRPSESESRQDDDDMMLKAPKSAMGMLCSSRKFQCCIVVVALGLVVGAIAAAVSVFSLSDPSQTVFTLAPTAAPSIAPSMAPTMPFWNLVGEIRSDVPSFGRFVRLDEEGNRVAVSAPLANNRTGEVVVYEQDALSVFDWKRVGQVIRGLNQGDEAGFSMAFTPDGKKVAMGMPGSDSALVYRVVRGEEEEQSWLPVDLPMEGNPSSRFGHSIAMNYDGTRVVVGAPGGDNTAGGAIGSAYVYELVEGRWKLLPGEAEDGSIRGSSKPGDAFGISVGMNQPGNKIVVGAPRDSSRWFQSGLLHVFEWKKTTDSAPEVWVDLAEGAKKGSSGSNPTLGKHCEEVSETTGYEEFHQLGRSTMAFSGSENFVASENTENGPGLVKIINAYQEVCGGWLIGERIQGGKQAGGDDNEGFGTEVDMSTFGMVVAATTRNRDGLSGEAGVYRLRGIDDGRAGWEQVGDRVGRLPLFTAEDESSMAKAPGVSVRILDDRTVRLAIGFENVSDSSGSVAAGLVRIYEFVAPEKWFEI